MTPPEGAAVISSIPDLHLHFKGQKLVWVFQEDKILFHLISLCGFLSLKIMIIIIIDHVHNQTTNYCNIRD